ncbi:hypothetical protein BSPCLSOX_882 [uncultured Gammaproteobacteria bacterium]|jgi:hypothetical protein|nr:hypothetical protein BSPCLSOX_882 [uncultured Gammaproteobacteria bacterium]VVM25532.1 hypothetical protein BSPWISOXPB_10006 [uncultured Gammaproteobacteria bacterium]
MVERKKIKEHGILKMQKEKGRIIVKEKGCEIDMFFKEKIPLFKKVDKKNT